MSRISADAYAELGEFLAWLHAEWDVPITAAANWPAYPASYGNNGVRMSSTQFTAFAGVCGHLHAPGNSHGDPGDLDVAAILAAAQPPKPVYRLLNLNARWPGFSSTPKTPTWATRAAQLATIVVEQRASIVTAQELGRDEAADLARLLGAAWHYQRNGLNTVLWADPWTLVDDKAGNQSRDWAIPEGLWPGATVLACRLVNGDTKQYVWAASTHLCSTGSGTLHPDPKRHGGGKSKRPS